MSSYFPFFSIVNAKQEDIIITSKPKLSSENISKVFLNSAITHFNYRFYCPRVVVEHSVCGFDLVSVSIQKEIPIY